MQSVSVEDPVLVVAIDFGTTYSGYAYSFRNEFSSNPLTVKCHNFLLEKGDQKSQNVKEPTCVLFNENQEFEDFGVNAEDRYAQICDKDKEKAKRMYFFHLFKMELHNQKSLSRDLRLLDKTGKKSMAALDVFSAAIRYLKDHVTSQLQKQDSLVNDDEIRWVLTMPAIWDDGSRQFMREAADMAGIHNDQLILALEPEAASVYCLHYFRRHQDKTRKIQFAKPGGRFMTVDCGGGTVDISVFEVGLEGTLKQLHHPAGAACGGTKVDGAFKDFLFKILNFEGTTTVENMEMLKLSRAFEKSKTSFGCSDRLAITLPGSLVESLNRSLRHSTYAERVNIVRNNLMLDKDIGEGFFKTSVDGIVSAIEKVLNVPNVGKVDAILLVGGFSESKVIQDAVKAAFPHEYVLVPPSASACVVMGAVVYGHCPSVVTCRVAAYTYGVSSCTAFIDGKHDPEKLEIIEGERNCKDIFNTFIHINDTVVLNETTEEQLFHPVKTGQTSMLYNIFRSTEQFPMYTTDRSCEKIGNFKVLMPDLTGEKNRKVRTTMSVSDTELKVIALDGNTGKEFSTIVDFLSQ